MAAIDERLIRGQFLDQAHAEIILATQVPWPLSSSLGADVLSLKTLSALIKDARLGTGVND